MGHIFAIHSRHKIYSDRWLGFLSTIYFFLQTRKTKKNTSIGSAEGGLSQFILRAFGNTVTRTFGFPGTPGNAENKRNFNLSFEKVDVVHLRINNFIAALVNQ